MSPRTRVLIILACLVGDVVLWNIDHRYFAIPITALGGIGMWLATTPIRVYLSNKDS